MDAVEYIREAKRLCKSRSVCKSASGNCPLLDENGHCIATANIYTADIIEKAEKAVQIVEQWSKAHPVKTRQSELLKMFPKAAICDDVISICPLFYCVNFLGTNFQGYCHNNRANCNKCCREYWLTEVTDND